MKINLNKQLTAFGKPCVEYDQQPIMLHKAIANCLIQARSTQPAKMMSICIKLHDSGEVDLDEPDLEFFKKAVESSQQATDLLVYSVLKEIDDQTKKAA